jgi:hypothetical protein
MVQCEGHRIRKLKNIYISKNEETDNIYSTPNLVQKFGLHIGCVIDNIYESHETWNICKKQSTAHISFNKKSGQATETCTL